MTASRSKHYWEAKQHLYPYQIEVVHMSDEDVDPRDMFRVKVKHFLRVPFNGVAHWGFQTPQCLEAFKLVSKARKNEPVSRRVAPDPPVRAEQPLPRTQRRDVPDL